MKHCLPVAKPEDANAMRHGNDMLYRSNEGAIKMKKNHCARTKERESEQRKRSAPVRFAS